MILKAGKGLRDDEEERIGGVGEEDEEEEELRRVMQELQCSGCGAVRCSAERLQTGRMDGDYASWGGGRGGEGGMRVELVSGGGGGSRGGW